MRWWDFYGLLGWGNGRGGVVEFGMFSGLFEVVDLVWRLLMKWMDGAAAWRWNMVKNIYLFLLKHILSPSFPSLSLSL